MKALPILLLFFFVTLPFASAQCDPDRPCPSPARTKGAGNQNTRGQTGGDLDGTPPPPSDPRIFVIPPPVFFPDWPSPFSPQAPDPKKILDKNGPQFPGVFSMSAFAVTGYAKGNWPIVIDYQQEKESFALLTVAADGVDPFYYRLQGSTKPGHWQEIVRLPARFGDRPVVAHYFVRALTTNLGEVKPAHLHIFGLGAGDKAVGSVGIDKITFRPGAIHPSQHQKAQYSFHSLFDFPQVEADVMRVGLLKDQIIAILVNDNRIKDGIRQDRQVSDDWDGKVHGKPCQGQHVLQVRAWRSSHDGGDWVAAWSQELVEVAP